MESRNVDFQFYTPDFDKAIEVFKVMEKSREYSPELSSVVNRGYSVRCYVTQKDGELFAASASNFNFDDVRTIPNGSTTIVEIDYIGMRKGWDE